MENNTYNSDGLDTGVFEKVLQPSPKSLRTRVAQLEIFKKLAVVADYDRSGKTLKFGFPPKELAKTDAVMRRIAERNAIIHEICEGNIGLVISIANRYRFLINKCTALKFDDLIQEGSIGLLQAIERFDYTKGNKFGTYATFWIKQSIQRSINGQERTIRVPLYKIEQVRRIQNVRKRLAQELGREPSDYELAERADIKVEKLRQLIIETASIISMDTSLGEDDGSSTLSDCLSGQGADDVIKPIDTANIKNLIDSAIEINLDEQEKRVLGMRYGFDMQFDVPLMSQSIADAKQEKAKILDLDQQDSLVVSVLAPALAIEADFEKIPLAVLQRNISTNIDSRINIGGASIVIELVPINGENFASMLEITDSLQIEYSVTTTNGKNSIQLICNNEATAQYVQETLSSSSLCLYNLSKKSRIEITCEEGVTLAQVESFLKNNDLNDKCELKLRGEIRVNVQVVDIVSLRVVGSLIGGLTKERARQIQARALRKLRKFLS